jgi:hypothetical protein
MAPHHDIAVEGQEEVLSDRLDSLERSPIDGARDTGRSSSRVRTLGADARADEHPQAASDAMERVALRH